MGDKFIIHTDDMRDKVRNPAMNSLILVRSSFSFLYHKRTVLSHCSFPSFFFLLTCQANESNPRDLLLQGPSNPIKAFQLNLTRTYSPNKYPIFFYNFTNVHRVSTILHWNGWSLKEHLFPDKCQLINFLSWNICKENIYTVKVYIKAGKYLKQLIQFGHSICKPVGILY